MSRLLKVLWLVAVLSFGSLVDPSRAQSCSSVVTTPNLSITSGSSFNDGDTVSFECSPGYSLIGAPVITCIAGGWSHEVPTCVMDCGDPGTPVNGSQVGTPSYLAYTTVNFQCDSGFSIIGASVSTCIDGSWSLPVPTCSPDCGDPGTPAQGSQVGDPTYLMGTTVTFECDAGYDLVGASVISCEDGAWSRSTPTCFANCIDPGTPDNGMQSGSYGNGGILTFTCNGGYSLLGASAISCSDGSWSNDVPTCEADCADPGTPVNGKQTGTFSNGDTLSFECNAGYTLVGARNATCRSGTYDELVPSCFANCVDPGTPTLGSQSGTYDHADVVTYSCAVGFELVGAEQITCEDGAWSNSVPSCLANCTDPGTPAFGSQTGNYGNSEVVFFNCSVGYTLVGAEQITCVNGGWSNSVPSCKADCTDPGAPAFGTQMGTYKHADVVTFNCSEDYELIGAAQITCADGSWSNDIPTCQAIVNPVTSVVQPETTTDSAADIATTDGMGAVSSTEPIQPSPTNPFTESPTQPKTATELPSEEPFSSPQMSTRPSSSPDTTRPTMVTEPMSEEPFSSPQMSTRPSSSPDASRPTMVTEPMSEEPFSSPRMSTSPFSSPEPSEPSRPPVTTPPPMPTRPTRPPMPSRPTSPMPPTTEKPDNTEMPSSPTYEPTDQPPTRPPKYCPPLWLHIHGMHRRRYRDGDKVVFSCKSGFAVVGPKWIVCFEGEWSGPVPECRRTCDYIPPAPSNGQTRYVPSQRNPWEDFNWEDLPPPVGHHPHDHPHYPHPHLPHRPGSSEGSKEGLLPDWLCDLNVDLLTAFLSLKNDEISWEQFFQLFLSGISNGDNNWPWTGDMSSGFPDVPWNDIFTMLPNGIPRGGGNNMAWETLFQMFPDGFPLGDTFPGGLVPGNGEGGAMRPEGEGGEAVRPGDEGNTRPGQGGDETARPGHGGMIPGMNGNSSSMIPNDRDFPWEPLIQQFLEWLESERNNCPGNMNTGDEGMRPGADGDGNIMPSPGGDSDVRPPSGEDGEMGPRPHSDGESRPGNGDGADDGALPTGDHGEEETMAGGDGGETTDEVFNPLEGVSQLIGLVSGSVPSPDISIGSLPWQQLFDLFPAGVPFADGQISMDQILNVFPRGLPGAVTVSLPDSVVPSSQEQGGSERINPGSRVAFPWSGEIPEGFPGAGSGSTWETLYQELPYGLPTGSSIVEWNALFMLFPNGPPMADEDSGDGWTGQVPRDFLSLGNGNVTWEELFQQYPNGVPVGDYIVPWPALFNVFPNGLPLDDEDSSDDSSTGVMPWTGPIPTGFFDLGDDSLTWEELYQQFPNGIPLGNETVAWEVLFLMFPDGPPMQNDDSSEESVNSGITPWLGLVPTDFLNLGDGSLTWDELYQLFPNGVPVGNILIPWEVLFMMFPNGPPSGDDWTIPDAPGDSEIVPWTGQIPTGFLGLENVNLTWEQLYLLMPNGIPIGDETISWEVLFIMFPNGPPAVSDDWSWLVSGLFPSPPQENPQPETGGNSDRPWEDLLDVILTWLPSTPEDESNVSGEQTGIRPPAGGQWSGLIPTGLFDIGDSSFETWEQLFQQLPNGLPFGAGNMQWEALFRLFPSGFQSVLEAWPWSLSQMFTANNGMQPSNMGGMSEQGEDQLRLLIQTLLEKLWSGEILVDLISHFQGGEIPWQQLASIFPNGITFGDITVPWQELIDLFGDGSGGHGGMSGWGGHSGTPNTCVRFPFGEFIPRFPNFGNGGASGMMPGSGGASGMMPGSGSGGHGGMIPSDKPPSEGDMLYFFCMPGYKLIGTPSLSCTCDGVWDGLPPMCKEIMKPTMMPDYTQPFAELTTIDIDDYTTAEPFEGTTDLGIATTDVVEEVTNEATESPKLPTDKPKASMAPPTAQPMNSTTSPKNGLQSTTQRRELTTMPKLQSTSQPIVLTSTPQPQDATTTSPQQKLASTAQPTDATSTPQPQSVTTTPQPKLPSTATPGEATTSPQPKPQTIPTPRAVTTRSLGESQSTAGNQATPIDPCSSNPCAEKANSECVSDGQGSFTCSCLPLFFESDGECASSSSFSGTLRITQIESRQAEFSEELQDPSSETFRSMAASMEKTIDSIYLTSSPEVAERYLGSTVLGFKNGSIVVDYVAHLNNTQNQPADDPTAIESAFEDAYMQSINTGSINITVDVAASTVTDLDECASEDTNDCSSDAACTNLQGSFTCQCLEGFIDASPAGRPGRICTVPQPSVCATSSDIDCSPNATCYDTDSRPEGFSCQCLVGFVDRSPRVTTSPGRICEEYCPSTNCFNGGSCVNVYETGEQICSCPDGYTGSRCEDAEQTGLSDTLILVISLTSVASLVIICVGLLLCFTFYHRQTKKNITKLSLRSSAKRDVSRFVRDEEIWDPIIAETRSNDSQQSLVKEPTHQDDYLQPRPSDPRHSVYPSDMGEDNPDFMEEEFESQARSIADAMSTLPEVERRMRREVRSIGNYNYAQEPDYRDNFVRPYMAPETIPIDRYLQDPRRYQTYDDESRGYGYGRPTRSSFDSNHHGHRMSLQQDLRGNRMYLPTDAVTMATRPESYPMEDFSSPRQSIRPTAQYPPASRAYVPASPQSASPYPPPPPPPPPPMNQTRFN
ncbi:uncharacterized protein LOC119745597 isoform X2 [Patiria miniata]|uniref:Sushi, von Willebrand factor type A, EGF and pentraxin domain-containing protein 1 n=1 Tax=Patiria miniata TaxID=46514 RepID=A0A914BNZ8_PATMI|nr:uncharacterized protein LOC119745597 isoform X2 [Patiria miniata]